MAKVRGGSRPIGSKDAVFMFVVRKQATVTGHMIGANRALDFALFT